MSVEVSKAYLTRPEFMAVAAGMAVVGAGVVFATSRFKELHDRRQKMQTIMTRGDAVMPVEQTTAGDAL